MTQQQNKEKPDQEKARKEFFQRRKLRRTRFYDRMAEDMNTYRYVNRKSLTKGDY